MEEKPKRRHSLVLEFMLKMLQQSRVPSGPAGGQALVNDLIRETNVDENSRLITWNWAKIEMVLVKISSNVAYVDACAK